MNDSAEPLRARARSRWATLLLALNVGLIGLNLLLSGLRAELGARAEALRLELIESEATPSRSGVPTRAVVRSTPRAEVEDRDPSTTDRSLEL